MRRSTPMPRPAFPLVLALLGLGLLGPGLAGCQNTKEMLGLTKRSPDEFQVVSRAPLSMPPDYSLRPPTPGAPRPQEGTVQQQAENIVTGYSNRNTSTLAPDQIPPRATSCRAMTFRWISLVPSPTIISGASRK